MLGRLKDILRAELQDKLSGSDSIRDIFRDADIDIDEWLGKKDAGTSRRNSVADDAAEYDRVYGTGSSSSSSYQQQYRPPNYSNPAAEKENGYYKALELTPGAGWDQIKKQYRKLMKAYHPDLFHNDPRKLKLAQEVSRQLNEAYNYFENKFGK
jgi:DnaJ-domain-containing protein 1